MSNSENYAIKDGDNYTLIKSNGDKLIVSASRLTFKEKDGRDIVVNREGIAYDLGLISPALSEEEAAKEAKDMLGTITIFFMIAYGISQLVSGKMYDKIGTRKGFSISVLLWGAADALTSMSCGLLSLTSFRMMLGLGEAGPWPGTTKSNAEWFPQKERALASGTFWCSCFFRFNYCSDYNFDDIHSFWMEDYFCDSWVSWLDLDYTLADF